MDHLLFPLSMYKIFRNISPSFSLARISHVHSSQCAFKHLVIMTIPCQFRNVGKDGQKVNNSPPKLYAFIGCNLFEIILTICTSMQVFKYLS